MPLGPLLEKIPDGDLMRDRFRTTWIDSEGGTHLAMLERPNATFAADEGFLQMLVEEAAILKHLDHPNVVRFFGNGESDGLPYLVVAWTEGRTLAEAQKAAAAARLEIPLGLACWIVASVARGLDHAQHVRVSGGAPLGVVHRDVAPVNVRLGWDGSVRLGGFAIARAALARRGTDPGILKGRFTRMAPEQVMAQPVDGKTDVFALGILLYELATGVLPFVGESDLATLERVRDASPRSPREHRPSLPSAVVFAIEQALKREPTARPSAANLAAMLDAWNDAQPEPGSPRALTRFLRQLFDPESLER